MHLPDTNAIDPKEAGHCTEQWPETKDNNNMDVRLALKDLNAVSDIVNLINRLL